MLPFFCQPNKQSGRDLCKTIKKYNYNLITNINTRNIKLLTRFLKRRFPKQFIHSSHTDLISSGMISNKSPTNP